MDINLFNLAVDPYGPTGNLTQGFPGRLIKYTFECRTQVLMGCIGKSHTTLTTKNTR